MKLLVARNMAMPTTPVTSELTELLDNPRSPNIVGAYYKIALIPVRCWNSMVSTDMMTRLNMPFIVNRLPIATN